MCLILKGNLGIASGSLPACHVALIRYNLRGGPQAASGSFRAGQPGENPDKHRESMQTLKILMARTFWTLRKRYEPHYYCATGLQIYDIMVKLSTRRQWVLILNFEIKIALSPKCRYSSLACQCLTSVPKPHAIQTSQDYTGYTGVSLENCIHQMLYVYSLRLSNLPPHDSLSISAACTLFVFHMVQRLAEVLGEQRCPLRRPRFLFAVSFEQTIDNMLDNTSMILVGD